MSSVHLIDSDEDCNVVDDHVSVVKKPKTSSRSSSIWDDFVLLPSSQFEDGKPRAKCKWCSKIYLSDSTQGTSNFRRHIPKCKARVHEDVNQMHMTYEGKIKAKTLDQEVYRELVAIAIMRHGYPFTWVEHEGNRDIHIYLNDSVKTISRNTAKMDCLQINKRERERLKHDLDRLPGRICLTCDMWTSCTTQGYLCLTAHYVDCDWKLNSRILSFTHVPPPHTAIVLYEKVYSLLKDWGIDKKILTLTLDNVRTNDNLQNSLREQLNLQDALLCDGDFFHIRCSAHILNLIVQEGLKVIDESLIKIRNCVKYIDGSEGRKLKFDECVQRVGLKSSKGLWMDVPTRWNSTYMMIERALIYRRAFASLGIVEESFSFCPSSEEWSRVENFFNVLKPFYDITNLFSGTDYPTANLYFECIWKIELRLLEEMESQDPYISDMAKRMKQKFKKYWDSYSVVLAFAVVLDPRYKLKFVKFCYQKLDEATAEEKVYYVRHQMYKLFREYANKKTPSNPSSAGGSRDNEEDMGDDVNEFDYFECEESDATKSQLDLYLDEPRLDRKQHLDILCYWKENNYRYPELSLMARDILTIPIATVASESAFSMGGRILTKWRSSLLLESAEMLITTRNWLYKYQVDEVEKKNTIGLEVNFSKLLVAGPSRE